MAYPVAAGDIVELVLRCVATGQENLTVLHMRVKSGGPIADGRSAIVALLAKLSLPGGLFEKWRACISDQVVNLTMRAQLVWPLRYLPVNNATSYTEGGLAGEFSSVNLAVAITRQGERANRHNTGTLHMPGVPEDFLQNSAVTVDGKAAYTSFAQMCIGEETVTGGLVWEHIIFNKATPADSVDPVQFKVGDYARTMHRRSVGLGS